MGEEKLVVSSSPHVRTQDTINSIMFAVIISLVPASVGAIYLFGARAGILILVCIVSALISETLFCMVRGKPITIFDGSAVVTGLLLALTLPATLPLWMAIVGSVVAICIGKQVFGGLGRNPFNPALVGRVFIFISFPVSMTRWEQFVDVETGATPLAAAKFYGEITSYMDLFIGNVGGSIGETSAFMLLIGLGYLLYKKIIDIRIPLGLVGTTALGVWILGQDPLFHVLAGGLLIGAFFMATDMVTSPVTKTGRWIFGIGSGLIVVIIRVYGGYPEGISFAILLMNAITPLIDRFTQGRKFGY